MKYKKAYVRERDLGDTEFLQKDLRIIKKWTENAHLFLLSKS